MIPESRQPCRGSPDLVAKPRRPPRPRAGPVSGPILAVLLFWTLPASGRQPAPPKVILFVPTPETLPAGSLERAVRAQVRDLSVDVAVSPARRPASRAAQARKRPSVLLAAWLGLDGMLFLWDRQADHPVRRVLPKGSEAVRIAAVALILRSAVSALLERSSALPRAGTRPRPRRVPPRPSASRPPSHGRQPGSRRLGKRWFGLGLAYSLDVFSSQQPTRQEPTVAFTFRPLAFLDLRLGLGAALPQSATAGDVQLETWSLLPTLGLSAFWSAGRFELGATACLLADVTFKKVTSQAQAVATDESTDLQWWAQAAGRLAFRPWPHLALHLEAGIRVAVSAKRYHAALPDTSTLVAPWPVQPVFELGLAFWL